VPWGKTKASRAPHTGNFRHQCEYVVWGSNGPLPASRHGGPWPGLVRERVDHRAKLHMTGKPVALVGELVKCVPPGGVILDPFIGSGSSGMAALQLGYRFFSIVFIAVLLVVGDVARGPPCACSRWDQALRQPRE
jgi:site-specific DNA-methyltransferase (adenine-specific)